MVDNRKVLGESGERQARRLLKKAGYRILESNYRTRVGELDVVAFEDGEIVFVEVKTRSGDDFGSGAEAVNLAKQRKLTTMARVYLQDKNVGDERPCRFDVVEIECGPQGEWSGRIIRDAFVIQERS